jgi:hypothetical protein
MSFEKFLTNMQAMFTGIEDNDEILTEAQKIRLLFQKVQSPSLIQVKNALQVLYDLDQDQVVTYNFAAEAANLPEHVPNRQASSLDSRGGHGGSAPESGIKGPDGVIFTGFYKNFQQLSDEDKQAIFDERKRLNIVPKRSRGSSRPCSTSSVKSKKKTLAKMTREIASLKVKKGASSNEADETPDNAGDQFGGRKSKKSKK